VSRVSKAVLATIAACPSAILKASLADEAAKLLGLPAAAVLEELEKVSASGRTRPQSAPRRDEDIAPREEEAPIEGERAAEAEPPPKRELALAAFLLANERDTALDAIIGEFLPREVFAHDFTWRFVEAWRAGVANGEDALAVFAEGLSPREREWFDELMLSAGRTNASTLTPVDIMQDYVRSLWCDALKRRRGSLPATGDPEADMERMKISADLKRLNMVKWHTVKEMVRQLIKGGK